MFLDSNENGRFDQKDQLLVGGVLKQAFTSSKPGSLLKSSNAGLITAQEYLIDDHADHDHRLIAVIKFQTRLQLNQLHRLSAHEPLD